MLTQTKIMAEIIDERTPLCRINMVLAEDDILMNMHLYGLSFDDSKIRRMVRNSYIPHLGFNLNRALPNSGRLDPIRLNRSESADLILIFMVHKSMFLFSAGTGFLPV